MQKKIHKNSICPLCDSGLKYKNCCGNNLGINPNTSMYVSEPLIDLSDFENEVLNKTGFYSSDFMNPIKNVSDVIYILIDESCFKDFYSISGVVVLKSEIDEKVDLQAKLYELVEKYNIDHIHFTEIFGRENLLGENRKTFIEEYTNILDELKTKVFSVCMTKDEISRWIQEDDITTEQCYIALTWKLMFNILIYCIYEYGNNLIIEMWRERENVTIEKRYLHQINCNDIIKQFPFANISIYKDYLLFMKSKILFSSLSDLAAYTTTKIFSKIEMGIPLNKIEKANHDLLLLFKRIFKDTTYMKNEKFDQIIKNIK